MSIWSLISIKLLTLKCCLGQTLHQLIDYDRVIRYGLTDIYNNATCL